MQRLPIYLASRSPRRSELLNQAGIAFHILLMREDARRGADIDETPHTGEPAYDHVMRVAIAKAAGGARYAAMRRLPLQPVLGADTIVVLDGEILGKPADAHAACELLARLSGRTHEVLTAVALAHGDRLETACSVSSVEFSPLEDTEIARYVASGEPLDKAGAYAIQGRAALFARAMSGSYSGIVGLPLFETAELLRQLDIPIL